MNTFFTVPCPPDEARRLRAETGRKPGRGKPKNICRGEGSTFMAAGLVIYRVYEITFDDGYVGRIAMSALRERSFRQEITEGKRTGIAHMQLIAETADRNKARALADGWEI